MPFGADLLGGAFDVAPADGLLIGRVTVWVSAGAGYDNVGAEPGECDCRASADAAQTARAGYDCYFAVEFAHSIHSKVIDRSVTSVYFSQAQEYEESNYKR